MTAPTQQSYNSMKNFVPQPEPEVDLLNDTIDGYLDTAISFMSGNCSELFQKLKQNANETVEELSRLFTLANNNSVEVDNWLTQCEHELSSSSYFNATSGDFFDAQNRSLSEIMTTMNSTTSKILGESDLKIFIERPEEMLHPAKINPAFYPIVITHTLTFLVGIIGNCVVIATWAIQGKFRTPTTVFLVSLSLADMLLLLLFVPLETLEYFMITSSQNKAVCKLIGFIEIVSAMATVLNLVAVSIERYLVIVYPMRARSWCTMHSTRIGLVIIWTLAMVLATPTLLTRDTSPITYHNATYSVTLHYCFDPETETTLAISIYQLLVMFILPAIFMVACYYVVIKQLWASTRSVKAMTQAEKEEVTNWKAQQPDLACSSRPSSESSSPLPVRAKSFISRCCSCLIHRPVRFWRRNSARRAAAKQNGSGKALKRSKLNSRCNSFRTENRNTRASNNSKTRIEWISQESLRVRSPSLNENNGGLCCAFFCCDCPPSAESERGRIPEVSECTVMTTFPVSTVGGSLSGPSLNGRECEAIGRSGSGGNVSQNSGARAVYENNNINLPISPLNMNYDEQWQVDIELGDLNQKKSSSPTTEEHLNGNNGTIVILTANSHRNSNVDTLQNESGLNIPINDSLNTVKSPGICETLRPSSSGSSSSRVRRSSLSITKTNKSRTLANNVMEITKSRIQVIKMLVLIVALFLLCWGPRLIMNLLLKLGFHSFNSATYTFRVVCNILSFVHSALNPFVYGFMSSKFRSMVCASFRRSKRKSHTRKNTNTNVISNNNNNHNHNNNSTNDHHRQVSRPHSQTNLSLHRSKKTKNRKNSLQNRSPLFTNHSVAPSTSNYRRSTVTILGANSMEMSHIEKY